MNFDALVVLQEMWDWRAMTTGAGYHIAPAYYRINPENHSGKRLYQLLGRRNFMVTNACKELVVSANDRGKPDPKWLANNLQACTYQLLLLCGKTAWDTYLKCGYKPKCRVVRMKHPAARDWTREEITRWQEYLK